MRGAVVRPVRFAAIARARAWILMVTPAGGLECIDSIIGTAMMSHAIRCRSLVPLTVMPTLLVLLAGERFCIGGAPQAERKADRGNDHYDLPHRRSLGHP
jgi:hypothetical protein